MNNISSTECFGNQWLYKFYTSWKDSVKTVSVKNQLMG